jgi:predicted nucleic acid-binding protein
MRICVDTAILIDILKDESRPFQEIFYSALSAREALVVPVVVFAELLPQFGGDSKLTASFLKDHKIQIEPLELDATVVAGQRWMRYLKIKTKAKCPGCGYPLSLKEHLLSDFFIGGFALIKCQAILTRDRGIYRKYFQELKGYGDCLGLVAKSDLKQKK